MLKEKIEEIIKGFGIEQSFVVEHPADEKMGDFSTNAALVLGGLRKINPREIAEAMAEKLRENSVLKEYIDRIDIAGPGFINFHLNSKYLLEGLNKVVTDGKLYGKNGTRNGEKVMVEYTDPNPFKQLHIGHLMSNTIGESISRLVEFSNADVCRACYQGDVGIHVAKAIWGIRNVLRENNKKIEDIENQSLEEKARFLGEGYARGAGDYEENIKAKEEIEELNKLIYQKSDEEVNKIYELGRTWSLEYFETIYKKLGTKFNEYFFESETGERGYQLVQEYLKKGVFKESEGAIVFVGEDYGLHTRVFINSAGLPTYEAKELGLAKTKYERFAYDKSIVITANEINDYFNVLLRAMSLIYPDLEKKTVHVGHGMLKLKTGKMSSRTGKVITGESLIEDVGDEIRKKMTETGKIKEVENVDDVINKVAVGAIKYSMLKQSPGKDISFDFETSLSFEGDSGPYLQYAYARANSILVKAASKNWDMIEDQELLPEERQLLVWINQFPEIVEVAGINMSPNLICSYLIELSSRFNHFYTKCQVIGNEKEKIRLTLVLAVAQILRNGLWLLGIEVVEKM